MKDEENRQLYKTILQRSKEPFYCYEPYYNRSTGNPSWQWKFLEATVGYKGRVALGGNRIGKSDQGAYEAVLAITGKHPYRDFPTQGIGWVVGLDNKMMDRVDRPKFEKFLPKQYREHYDKQKNIWYCEGDGRYWEVEFKSTEMGAAKFQGAEVDWIWFDEEPKKTEIFSECETRFIDRRGIWWMTATPILGTAWLKALSERDNVFTTVGAMYDNPYLPLEEIEAKRESYSEDEWNVRVEGIYLVFGGKPVFRDFIKSLNQRLVEIKNEIPSDVGVLKVA